MIILNYPQSTIKFENYEKFILPFLRLQTIPSTILYKIEDDRLRIRTFMNGFVIVTHLPLQEIIDMYKDKEVGVGLTPPTNQSQSDILNKFNQDYMDNRGIPELE